MAIPAVPKYIRREKPEFYLDAPPGHRFLLYLPAWGENQESRSLDWRSMDRVPKIDRRSGEQKVGLSGPKWEDVSNDRFAFEVASCTTPSHDEERPRLRRPAADRGLAPWRDLMQALLSRQQSLAAPLLAAGALAQFHAAAVAPFTTGLGNEHPLENGFAFLNPYGLPYLPGSGVKGVLRAAALELGWPDDEIRALFGHGTDNDTELLRGALSFWDVLPQVEGDRLLVDVMTPHQTHYYAKGDTPHDSGQPNPISFLTVPPKSHFVFHVACDLAHLDQHAADLAAGRRWQQRLAEAFEHAFAWLGFGAKTAVGYGAMTRDARAEEVSARAAAEAIAMHEREAERARLTEQQRAIRDFVDRMRQRQDQLGTRKTKVGQEDYQQAQALAKSASGADWSAADRAAAVDAIEHWTPRLVAIEPKDLRKRLGLAILRGAA